MLCLSISSFGQTIENISEDTPMEGLVLKSPREPCVVVEECSVWKCVRRDFACGITSKLHY